MYVRQGAEMVFPDFYYLCTRSGALIGSTMEYNGLSYIYGLSTMFFGMMAAYFWYRGERLHKLVALLTGTIALECVKDFVMVCMGLFSAPDYREAMTAVDMVAVPMYAFVLTELVRPGRLTLRSMVWQEVPFVALLALYIITGSVWIFYVELAWAAVYGTAVLVWTAVNIPRYNRHLKEAYSYTENVNLGWLRVILYTFYVILGLWILDCVVIHLDMEFMYLLSNLSLWMVIFYFLFRHESVIDELSDWTPDAPEDDAPVDNFLALRIEELFAEGQVFLNPNLKLSDVARAVGSNRTYVSNYFNRRRGTTFYDYVNGFRIEYSTRLLTGTDHPIKTIAQLSGFNSDTSFIRTFSRIKGCTPAVFRERAAASPGGDNHGLVRRVD